MTYDATESSTYDGNPVELYRAVVGAQVFRYTSGIDAIVHNGETYTPIAISRTDVEQGKEINRQNLTITVPRDNPLALLFRAFAPASVVSMTVFRTHPTDGNFVTIWSGRVLSVTWAQSKAEMTCEPVFTSLKQYGLRRNYGPGCPHTLYSVGCGVNQLTYKTSGAVTDINGGVLTITGVSAFSDGYFNGGFVQYLTTTGALDTRMILSHTGGTVTIPMSFESLTVGQTVDVYPGCKLNLDDCENKYNNILNYGGWPYIPGINPFNGAVIY